MYNDDGLRKRSGPAPRLIEGPKTGQRSLYQQQVLDEDSYTEALSHIIQRDFFPNLPHLNATNDYLSALSDNDPDKLRSSIRKLAKLAQDKEEGRSPGRSEQFDDTPRINRPVDVGRTPVGARGWETPGTVRRPLVDDFEPGPSRKKVKRTVRDDLGLDAFQRNYTSEDNASFVHVMEEENRMRKEDQNAWAFDVERVTEGRRLEGVERRKMILDAATNGEWRVDANGRRLITGLGSGGTDRTEGEAWKERKMIEAKPKEDEAEAVKKTEKGKGKAPESSSAVAKSSAGALIKATDASAASALPPPPLHEEELPAEHPLSKALVKAGLPPTALVSTEDGAIVPHHESASGSGDGRGRGMAEKARRDKLESGVMGDDEPDVTGGRMQQWPYKAMNGLMFPPDAYAKPFDQERPKVSALHPPSISHRNTRIADEEEESGSAPSIRGSTVAESWVDRAITGEREEYALLNEADPDPEDLPPLMTYGTLLATPRALDGSTDPLDGPKFKFPEPKSRDELGRKLGTKASKAMSERARSYQKPSGVSALRAAAARTRIGDSSSGGKMGPPATPRREGNLTPAARSLLDRSLGRTPRSGMGLSSGGSARGAAMERGSGWGGGNRGAMSWTPSPAPRRPM
ncbi:hypothetical protein CcaverHIS002_0200830 [Cutaneotrichosporon cavernicola]|uniref:Protein DGCR14 n=1 Tax=Cutaneotrichosporon cavernicola TaxID=279322 RepID=A0AA48ID34_9TREE|nr:uncharacterized protein CcaverHIS019_0200880 [Cutaneotrichosporon cavernicola]BEI80923.1 hypothetical protein CcaverHIS002_0200830 [Cutaneotrichosporon cavernicola]BEI88726.1 hypothetical protein CcaverHIS019_0200880 [Cutaneotrichosporon cavernicola]BEI96500.1 hypothetical protein CcaverHIS631_0200890 [Cutaneotrichosporon cavernicola]BEJ04271.1 hypothetical protein CcaverHIS641_0200880 [Cutaneotrichosporon cavernicola]